MIHDTSGIEDENIRKRCEEINKQAAEWDDRLNRQRAPRQGISIAYYFVTRIDGGDIREVPGDVLINFADRWGYNFGGKVEIHGELAYVQVYID